MTSDSDGVPELSFGSRCRQFRFNDESFSVLGVQPGDYAVVKYGPVKCGSLAAVHTPDCGPIVRIVCFDQELVRLRAINPLFRDLWYSSSQVSIVGTVENIYSPGKKPIRFPSPVQQPRPLISWAADERGKNVGVSETLSLATGQDLRKFLQDRWVQLVHPEEQEFTLKTWYRSVETGEGFDMHFHIRSLMGGYMKVHSTATPVLSDSGKLIHWAGSVKIAAPTVEGFTTRFLYPEKLVS